MYLLGKLCKKQNPVYIVLMMVYFAIKEWLTVHYFFIYILYIDIYI